MKRIVTTITLAAYLLAPANAQALKAADIKKLKTQFNESSNPNNPLSTPFVPAKGTDGKPGYVPAQQADPNAWATDLKEACSAYEKLAQAGFLSTGINTDLFEEKFGLPVKLIYKNVNPRTVANNNDIPSIAWENVQNSEDQDDLEAALFYIPRYINLLDSLGASKMKQKMFKSMLIQLNSMIRKNNAAFSRVFANDTLKAQQQLRVNNSGSLLVGQIISLNITAQDLAQKANVLVAGDVASMTDIIPVTIATTTEQDNNATRSLSDQDLITETNTANDKLIDTERLGEANYPALYQSTARISGTKRSGSSTTLITKNAKAILISLTEQHNAMVESLISNKVETLNGFSTKAAVGYEDLARVVNDNAYTLMEQTLALHKATGDINGIAPIFVITKNDYNESAMNSIARQGPYKDSLEAMRQEINETENAFRDKKIKDGTTDLYLIPVIAKTFAQPGNDATYNKDAMLKKILQNAVKLFQSIPDFKNAFERDIRGNVLNQKAITPPNEIATNEADKLKFLALNKIMKAILENAPAGTDGYLITTDKDARRKAGSTVPAFIEEQTVKINTDFNEVANDTSLLAMLRPWPKVYVLNIKS